MCCSRATTATSSRSSRRCSTRATCRHALLPRVRRRRDRRPGLQRTAALRPRGRCRGLQRPRCRGCGSSRSSCSTRRATCNPPGKTPGTISAFPGSSQDRGRDLPHERPRHRHRVPRRSTAARRRGRAEHPRAALREPALRRLRRRHGGGRSARPLRKALENTPDLRRPRRHAARPRRLRGDPAAARARPATCRWCSSPPATTPSDKIAGLTLGGDDYVTKPFSLEEVVARIRAVPAPHAREQARSRRLAAARSPTWSWTRRRTRCAAAGEPIELSPTEFKLLRYLMLNAGRVLSKAQILDHVWDYDFGGDDSIVESYISYLRRKVDDRRAEPLIHTCAASGTCCALPVRATRQRRDRTGSRPQAGGLRALPLRSAAVDHHGAAGRSSRSPPSLGGRLLALVRGSLVDQVDEQLCDGSPGLRPGGLPSGPTHAVTPSPRSAERLLRAGAARSTAAAWTIEATTADGATRGHRCHLSRSPQAQRRPRTPCDLRRLDHGGASASTPWPSAGDERRHVVVAVPLDRGAADHPGAGRGHEPWSASAWSSSRRSLGARRPALVAPARRHRDRGGRHRCR